MILSGLYLEMGLGLGMVVVFWCLMVFDLEFIVLFLVRVGWVWFVDVG